MFLQENCAEFEFLVIQQCDELINALEARKLQLIDYVRQDRDSKVRALKEQVQACTSKLQHTTAVMQFCIEALKENDSSAFLQNHFLNKCLCIPPNAPTIIPEECSAENNSVTVAWQPPATSYVEAYVLELDDGNGGEFRVCLSEVMSPSEYGTYFGQNGSFTNVSS
ncbi:unnamed protein product [Nesidiocoris tenuis]|uniref:Fibronectin type-III domain-containing protein n=1 Tax=Nesidiocoris tenuis TaxID=355587 RepID=A0A6H5HCN6_9HEMI|nr:unnamed protein product [Nesidiocoris tenuis]CAB0014633.1 unnamed protein product [Nesidiocoris tenuis]